MEINCKEDALQFLALLENGTMKIVEKTNDGKFELNITNKELVQKVFSYLPIEKHINGDKIWRDKIPLLTKIDHFRMVPGAIIRAGACIKEDAIIMPSFVNIGTYIGSKTMIDSGVTIGSCAYIGNRCHVSSNVVIAGVLEPISQMPVIVDDDVFIIKNDNNITSVM
jgi:2,3,4,5-tetrahydropyridine-2-carboxylate N-succinyltransferase